ncbi:MAG: hypothetical protein OK454_08945 [Thaumarchaeota archaeon]|nr:hypothetical protein [Nitrososphaerota archaeon]
MARNTRTNRSFPECGPGKRDDWKTRQLAERAWIKRAQSVVRDGDPSAGWEQYIEQRVNGDLYES